MNGDDRPVLLLDGTPEVEVDLHQAVLSVEELAHLDRRQVVDETGLSFQGVALWVAHDVGWSYPRLGVVSHPFHLAAVGVRANEDRFVKLHKPYGSCDDLSVRSHRLQPYVLVIEKGSQLEIDLPLILEDGEIPFRKGRRPFRYLDRLLVLVPETRADFRYIPFRVR